MPIPNLITIGDFEIRTIVIFLLIFSFVYILSFWWQSKDDLKSNSIFDIGFLTLVISLLSARILGVLTNLQDYLDKGWSLIPITEIDNGLKLFYELPWSILGVADGNFEYIGIFLGLVLGLLFTFQNSNQKKTVYLLFDRIILSYLFASVFLLIGLFIAGIDMGAVSTGVLVIDYGGGISRHAVQIYQLLVSAGFIVIYFVFKSAGLLKQGVLSVLFLIVFGISEVLIRPLVSNYNPEILNQLDFHQVIAITIAVVGLILAVSQLDLPFFKGGTKQDTVPERIQHNVTSGQPFNRNRFTVSFTDRIKQVEQTRADRKTNE